MWIFYTSPSYIDWLPRYYHLTPLLYHVLPHYFFSCFHCFRSWTSFRQKWRSWTHFSSSYVCFMSVHMAVYCPLHKIRLFVKAATLQRTSREWHPAAWNCSHGCLCTLATAVTDHIQSSPALYGKMANNSHLFPKKKSAMKRNSRLWENNWSPRFQRCGVERSDECNPILQCIANL